MKQLNRFEMAAVKRTALNTKKLNTDLLKVVNKINELLAQASLLKEEISRWEAPIIEKYGVSSTDIITVGGVPEVGDMPVDPVSTDEEPIEDCENSIAVED